MSSQTTKTNGVKLILLSGLLVGTLDILAACTDYYIATGKGPEGLLRYIASGVFGQSAFTRSSSMMLWGLLFHFIIAYSFTFLFYFMYRRWNFVRRYPVAVVIIYGIFMWAVTTQVILPLSNTPPAAPLILWKVVKATLVLIVMISLPLMLIHKRVFRNSFAT
ncbi:MAG: hypothetical protein B6D37_09535 [Sphingobacteriales bacterium UTBCD1]|jgi:hypothetical protein|nr:MAG: hypothetical protein B6D37_09535 [Sphingobacteriales bacterium UTBCD1]